ncbi:alpha/beta hydrolase [Chitinimonas sp. PSY-7]|uniref:alpha/beta fold hydrolase n=1 Tax=Chitinimonas sp. PSY-7 TaxID=3459088 RepID=UPI0040401526
MGKFKLRIPSGVYKLASELNLEILSVKPLQARDCPPILFIHGAYAGAWCWQPHFLPYFSDLGYPCFALSLRGHGDSEGRSGLANYRIDEYSNDVERVVRYIEVETGRTPVLIGHSMGGYLAMAYSRKQALPGLALLAPVPPEGLLGSVIHLFWRHPQLLWELNALQNLGLPPRLDKLRELLFSAELSDDALRRYVFQFQRESDRALIDMNMPQFDQRPPCGSPAVLVLGSKQDLLMPPHLVHSAAKALGVHAQMFTGVGHVMMLDAAWRKVAEALALWLESLL